MNIFLADNYIGLGTRTGSDLRLYTSDSSIAGITIKTPTGNVGIGTTAPTAKLNVVGSANFTGNISSENFETDIFNTSVGYQAGNNLGGGNAGNYITAVGYHAGYNNSNNELTAIGGLSGYNNTGWGATTVGFRAGIRNKGHYVTSIGYDAGQENKNSYLTAIGYTSASSNLGASVTSIGAGAGQSNIGNDSVFIGAWSGIGNKGHNVTAIGYGAGGTNSDSLLENIGNDSVFIGYDAGKGNRLNNQFILKQNSINAIPLIQGNFSSGILTCYGGAGCWAVSSDKSLKTNIKELDYGLKDIMKLNPVRYDWKSNNLSDIGFIAQDMKLVIPEIVSGGNGSMTVSYGALTPVIIKAMQEQQQIIIKQNNTINLMKEDLCSLGVKRWC
jgi:hypothetical protein